MRYILLFTLLSCAHSYHQAGSDFSLNPKSKNGNRIKATASQFVFLGFRTQTDYVNEAVKKLESQCVGVISPVTTKYYTDLGFLSWTNQIVLEGVCLK
jgi:hypothetical protein